MTLPAPPWDNRTPGIASPERAVQRRAPRELAGLRQARKPAGASWLVSPFQGWHSPGAATNPGRRRHSRLCPGLICRCPFGAEAFGPNRSIPKLTGISRKTVWCTFGRGPCGNFTVHARARQAEPARQCVTRQSLVTRKHQLRPALVVPPAPPCTPHRDTPARSSRAGGWRSGDNRGSARPTAAERTASR